MAGKKMTAPYVFLQDNDGSPLQDGYVYFGEVGKNPEAFPISVYWDAALSIPAANPVRTSGGFLSHSGKAGNIYIGVASYSITIRNKKGELLRHNDSQSGELITTPYTDAFLATTDSDSAWAILMTGLTLAAARADLDVPSNDEVILDSLLTAVGDIIYASAIGVPAVLPAGSINQVLTMGASVPQWSTFQKPSLRQTVLAGAVATATGLSTFVSAGTGRACSLAATTTPVQITYAAGYNDGSPIDYGEKISADAADCWAALTANSKHYLYREYGVGYGSVVNLPPVYGRTYVKANGSGKMYADFNGVDAATTFTDANPNVTHTFAGNAQLDTADSKFGSASLLLDGTGDYDNVTGFTFHGGLNDGGFEFSAWFKLNAVGIQQNVVATNTVYSMIIRINASNQLQAYLSSDGSTFNIASATAGTTAMSTGIWYRVRVAWDGNTYKYYLSNNGAAETEEISVASTSALYSSPGYKLGSDGTGASEFFNGWIDEVHFRNKPVTLGTEVPSAYPAGGLASDTEHWFDTNRMVMAYWNRATATWVDTNRVFMGECTTDASSATNVIAYTLRGEYLTDRQTPAVNTVFNFTHNLGVKPRKAIVLYSCVGSDKGWVTGDELVMSHVSEAANGTLNVNAGSRLSVEVVHQGNIIIGYANGTGSASPTYSEWKMSVLVNRGW